MLPARFWRSVAEDEPQVGSDWRLVCRAVGARGVLYREAVTELSPGWRLGGTLGIGIKKRVALKERKNRSKRGQ
jgi:hypothetical protein